MLIPGLFRGSGQAVLARAPGNRPAVAISEEASIKRGMCGQSVEKEGEKEENKEAGTKESDEKRKRAQENCWKHQEKGEYEESQNGTETNEDGKM